MNMFWLNTSGYEESERFRGTSAAFVALSRKLGMSNVVERPSKLKIPLT